MNHSDYLAYLETPEWKARAEAAKKRVGYKCQSCKGTGQLDAHHTTYTRLGHEDDSDIAVLCRRCHEHKHGKDNSPKYYSIGKKKRRKGKNKKHYKPYCGKLGTSRMGDGIYTPRTGFGRAR